MSEFHLIRGETEEWRRELADMWIEDSEPRETTLSPEDAIEIERLEAASVITILRRAEIHSRGWCQEQREAWARRGETLVEDITKGITVLRRLRVDRTEPPPFIDAQAPPYFRRPPRALRLVLVPSIPRIARRAS